MRKNQVRRHTGLKLLKEGFNLFSTIREETFFEGLRNYGICFSSAEKPFRTSNGLLLSGPICAEDYPRDIAIAVRLQELKNGPTTPNFDVVRVSS